MCWLATVKGKAAEDVARWADCQALDADIIQCIQLADELHTMTSLSGFEA
jgi:capsular polysaccharide export protein